MSWDQKNFWPLVENYYEQTKKSLQPYVRTIVILSLLSVLHGDISTWTQVTSLESSESLIDKTKHAIDNIIIEFKRGLRPPY